MTSYYVRTQDGQVWKRHVDQIRRRHSEVQDAEDAPVSERSYQHLAQPPVEDLPQPPEDLPQAKSPDETSNDSPVEEEATTPRPDPKEPSSSGRPRRTIKKPSWLKDYEL